MSFCTECGVEIEEARENCPLCEGTLTDTRGKNDALLQQFKKQPYPEATTSKSKRIPWTGKKKRFFVLELLSLVAFIAVAVILSIYFFFPHNGTWVYFTLAAIGLAWTSVSIPLILTNRFSLVTVSEILTIISFLAALDLQDGELSWFKMLALPMVVLVTIITTGVVSATRKAKTKGANIGGFILLGVSVLTLGLDIIIALFLKQQNLVTWSIYVIIPATTLALLLLYIHYRLSKVIDINKRFKI